LLISLTGFAISEDLQTKISQSIELESLSDIKVSEEFLDLNYIPLPFILTSLANRKDVFAEVKKNLNSSNVRIEANPYILTVEMGLIINAYGKSAIPFLLNELFRIDEKETFCKEHFGSLLTTIFYCEPNIFPSSGILEISDSLTAKKIKLMKYFKNRIEKNKPHIYSCTSKGLNYLLLKLKITPKECVFLKSFLNVPIALFNRQNDETYLENGD
jgi:hypothetical protein